MKPPAATSQPFYITLPKITVPEQAEALSELMDKLEERLGLKKHTFQADSLSRLRSLSFPLRAKSR